jgi:hypothetical protein
MRLRSVTRASYVAGFATFTGTALFLNGNAVTDDPKQATRYATEEEAQLAADSWEKLSQCGYPVFTLDLDREPFDE